MFKKFGILILSLFLVACSNQPSRSPAILQDTAAQPNPTATNVPPAINLTTSGRITRSETWRGEIHITGDISFANGAKLTIEPGTTVYLASNQDSLHQGGTFDDAYTRDHNDPVRLAEWESNAIVIDGRKGIIHAVGTPEQPIVFRPEGDSTSPAQWDGIYIEQGTLQHAVVLYGGRTAVQAVGSAYQVEIAYNEVRYFHWAGIDSHKSNVWIHHNLVEGGGHLGIGARKNSLVEHNIVLRSATGIGVEESDGVMVRNNLIIDCANGVQLMDGKNIQVLNNTIAWIQGPPDGWYYQGELIYPPSPELKGIGNHLTSPGILLLNNIVFGPFDHGIALYQVPGEGSLVDFNLTWEQPHGLYNPDHPVVGAHHYSEDPLFVDPANGDFELRAGSPAFDAGSPEILDADGSPSDLGAYGGPQGTGW